MRPDKIKNFKLNAEMLGKVSRFLSRGIFIVPNFAAIRIEQFCSGGAKITATDGHRLIIFIDPGSDFSGPALSLENQGYPLSKFTKEYRKTKSSIEELQGYALFKPNSGKVALNGKTFKFSFNTDKWLPTDRLLEGITRNKGRNLPLFNTRYITDVRHCILSEERKYTDEFGTRRSSQPNVAFSHFKINKTANAALGSIFFSSYAILVIMPVKPRTHEQNLLSRINYFRNQETNPFVLAVMQKECGGIFTKFKLRK